MYAEQKKGIRDTIEVKNTSVCCSGYYIKVAQISCPPPPTTPVVEGVQTAGSQLPPVRGSPRRFVDSISRHRPSVFVFALQMYLS